MKKINNFREFIKNEGLISHSIGSIFGKNPKKGDYVLIVKNPHDTTKSLEDLENFLYTNIGRVVKYQINDYSDEHFWNNGYVITFENIPENILFHFKNIPNEPIMYFDRNKIEHFSTNKKEMEDLLEDRLANISADKYNL